MASHVATPALEGLRGYREFQSRLAGEISPEEALQAEQAFFQGRRVLLALLLLVGFDVAVAACDARLPAWSVVWDLLGVLSSGAAALGMLLAVTRYGVPFAARLVLPISFVLAASDAPDDHWSNTSPAEFWFLCAFGFVLAWLVDYGASPQRLLRQPVRARLALLAFVLIFGGLLALVLTFVPGSSDGAETIGVALNLAVVAAWIWLGPRLAAKNPRLDPDAEAVHAAAWRRWRAMTKGRILALLFALFPFVLFLGAFSIEERLAHAGDPGVVRTSAGTPGAWFWASAGRFLTSEDLASQEFYGLCRSRQGDLATELEAEMAALNGSIDTALPEGLARVRERLAPFRLSNLDAFATLVGECGAEAPLFAHPSTARARPDHLRPGGYEVGWVESLGLLRPVTADELRRLRAGLSYSQGLLLVTGLLGFLLLWRRGGESPAAAWLAIFIVSVGYSAMEAFVPFGQPAIQEAVWRLALLSPLSGIVSNLLGTLAGLSGGLTGAAILLFVVAWTYLCWPAPMGPRRFRRARFVLRLLVALAACLGVVVAWVLPVTWLLGDAQAVVTFVTRASLLVPMVLLGALFRRRFAQRSEVPRLGLLPAVWVCALGVARGLADAELWAFPPRMLHVGPWSVAWLDVLGFLLLALVSSLAAWILLRQDLFEVSGGRHHSSIVLLVLLPLMFEKSEDLAGLVLEQTPFFSATGQELLGVVIIVALLGPIQKLIEKLVSRLAVPGLRGVERAVAGAVELIADAQGGAATREAAAGFFERMKVPEYVLYARAPGGAFRRLITALPQESPEQLVLSERLRTHLGEAAGAVVDLRRVPYQWTHFFLQFELARLESASAARYLLPIRLGSSVRGLLLLPDGSGSQAICKDLVGDEVGKLGLVVVETGRVA